ncbi:MAG TPA: mechanosensitive ion channel family protein [Chloroflexaceae bacterium]|nr:mechanosensitive ion channel family protein [Chloroflexaceae bacterium]
MAASAPRRLRGAWAQRLLLALLAILLALSTPHQLAAQDERVTVRLDGRALFRVGPTTDADAATRARRVERRLATLLENPQAIVPARVEPGASEGEQIVTVAGVPVVTVTVADAEDNVTTPAALAALWAQRIDTALVEGRARRLAPGGRFAAEVQSAVTAAFARLGESALTIVPRALAALLVLGLFWLLASLVRRLLRFVFKRLIADLTVENLIRQLTYYAIWALGLLVAVDALGFDPQTVVTGLGLTGLALGFALKDIISNFVSGLLILGLRPFQIGDQIVVGETEGSVERIELRATQIRTYDGRVVLVPNAEVFTSRVTNNTASPVRRGRVTIFLGYDVDLPRAMQIARDAAQEAEGVLETPPVSAVVSTLGQDDVVVEVRFWSDSRRSDVVATTSAVQLTVVAALRAAGITLPDPDVRLVKLRGSAA